MKKEIMGILIFFIVMIIVGCNNTADKSIDTEEAVATGILEIKSSPSEAQIYVDGELKGDTPFTLYNFQIGSYKVVIKKQGYIDFEKTAVVKAGRIEEIEAILTTESPVVEEKPPMEEGVIEEEKVEDTTEDTAITETNKIYLTKFALYFDIDNKEVTSLRTGGSDIFLRNYEEYVHFTTLGRAKIMRIDKPIRDIKKDDCVSANSAVGSLFSEQTFCVKNAEGSLFAIGGTWEENPSELWLVALD